MTPQHEPVFRRATADDAARLAAFGATAFREAFAAQNTAADMAAYLAKAFGPDIQRAEIADPGGTVLLAEAATGEAAPALPLAYSHLVAGATPACVTGPAPCELKRFYVASAAHGRGLAQRLMTATLDAARERGARTLWLGVWEHNARAIAFYRKCGFERAGEQRFVLGSDVQTDWIMARGIDATA